MSTVPALAPEPRWRRQVRAVLILLHLIAVTVMAFPSPGEGMYRQAWDEPNVQQDLAVWRGFLGAVGVHMSQEEFTDWLWQVALRYTRTQDLLERPFQPYYAVCGTIQSWRMFAGPQRHPSRLVVEVEERGAWRTIFVERDPHHRWRVRELDDYRLRPALYRMSWGLGGFGQFADWVAVRARQDFPEATRVRVSLRRQRTPSAAEVRAGAAPVPEAERVEERELGSWP
jgi:hypothetical protein